MSINTKTQPANFSDHHDADDFVVRALQAEANKILPSEQGLHQALLIIDVTPAATIRYNKQSYLAQLWSDFFQTMEQRWKLLLPAALVPVAVIAIFIATETPTAPLAHQPAITTVVVAEPSPETITEADALIAALTADLLIEDTSIPDEDLADQAYINIDDSAQFDGI